MLDKATAGLALHRGELRPATRTFDLIKDFIDETFLEDQTTKMFTGVASKRDYMDVGALGSAAPEEEGTYIVAEHQS